jgi:hypothetical protein
MNSEQETFRSITTLTRSQKLKIRKLYLADLLPPKEIASKYNIREGNFRVWIHNQGWTKERQKIEALDNLNQLTETKQTTEYKTQRQLDFYSNLQEKTEELTEKALLNAAEAEGISELNTALGSVKSAVSLFEEASAKLGESLQTSASVAESGNQYNFFYLDADKGREILAKCKDQGKVIDI